MIFKHQTQPDTTVSPENSQHEAMTVSGQSIAVNVALSAMKLLAGVLAHSAAMVSDGIHSASDVLSTVVVILGIKISGREPDADHPYGHERLECVAAIVLAVLLGATGIGIGYSGITRLGEYFRGTLELTAPGTAALIAALVSIAVKEGMYRYTRAAALRLHSTAMMADAWHHRSDALSSIGSFVGVLGARLGCPVLDPIAGLVICVFILKAAWNVFMDAVRGMTDKAASETVQADMRAVIASQKGVLGIDELKTRVFGPRLYADVEISADGDLPLREAHAIAERVHDAIEEKFPEVKHCMVHVNPDKQ